MHITIPSCTAYIKPKTNQWSNHNLLILFQAWKHWRNQTPLEIVDPGMKGSCSQSEVIKCIQIGLLCVQDNPENRPTMARIVSYLSTLLAELPLPQEPAFHADVDLNLNLVSWESSIGQSTNNSLTSSNHETSKSHHFPR